MNEQEKAEALPANNESAQQIMEEYQSTNRLNAIELNRSFGSLFKHSLTLIDILESITRRSPQKCDNSSNFKKQYEEKSLEHETEAQLK